MRTTLIQRFPHNTPTRPGCASPSTMERYELAEMQSEKRHIIVIVIYMLPLHIPILLCIDSEEWMDSSPQVEGLFIFTHLLICLLTYLLTYWLTYYVPACLWTAKHQCIFAWISAECLSSAILKPRFEDTYHNVFYFLKNTHVFLRILFFHT